jgi:hypothetical protein
MSKRPSKDAISEVVLSLPEVTKKLAEMKMRIERLEEHTGAAFYPLQLPPAQRRMGRKPKLELKELLMRRDLMVPWVEQHWPYLSVTLGKVKNAQHAAAAFIVAKERMSGVCHAPFYRDPEQYADNLWKFLKSRNFRGNPRNLAGAMAGLPELSWKRSFDVCSCHPCKLPVATQAYWDYMRRRFPDRLRELQRMKTEEQVEVILKKSRTHDPTYLWLKENPEKVLD